MTSQFVTYKTKEEMRLIKEGGHILGEILQKLGAMVKPGLTTEDLEIEACRMIIAANGRPAFKHYHTPGEVPFPTALCTSINNAVVHSPATPAQELKESDIIGIDIGMEWQGLYTDTAITVAVGKISKEAKQLMDVTKKALEIGIAAAQPGAMISDIGKAVEQYVKPFGYGIVRDLVGHGVGYQVHEEPRIPNYYDRSLPPVVIKEGMVIAIEPMINAGDWRVIFDEEDGWTIRTKDGSLSAHFEHTLVITKDGPEIATI